MDLDGLNSFLRSLLPGLCRSFPNLPIIGISTRSTAGDLLGLNSDLELDACLDKLPRPEDLIVSTPDVAAKYLYDTQPLH